MAKVTIKIEEDIANELKKKMNVRDTYSDVIRKLIKNENKKRDIAD